MLRQLLKYKYLLIGLLIGFLYYSSYNYKDLQNEYAKILNISGKQRMLSQRLVILSKIYHVKRTSSLRKELEDTLLEIELAHKYLVKNTFTPELESIYFKQGLDKNIKTYLSNFYNLLKTNDENYITNARDNSKNILIQLDSAVKAYEKYINEQIKNIDIYKNMMITGLLLTIFILLYFFMELRSRSKINTELSNELQKTIDIISEYVIYSKTDLKGVILEASDAFCSIAQY